MYLADDCWKYFSDLKESFPEGLNLKFMCGSYSRTIFYNMKKCLVSTSIFLAFLLEPVQRVNR